MSETFYAVREKSTGKIVTTSGNPTGLYSKRSTAQGMHTRYRRSWKYAKEYEPILKAYQAHEITYAEWAAYAKDNPTVVNVDRRNEFEVVEVKLIMEVVDG